MKVGTLEIELLANMARLQKDMADAKQTVSTSMGAIEKSTASASAAIGTFTTLVKAMVFGGVVREVIQLADGYTKYTSQLKLATQSQQEFDAAVARSRQISRLAQSDIGATATLYARIANGTRELGVAQKTVGDITEVTSLALKVSGASSAEAASAMLQLSQSFASGVFRGEEFNSVAEAAPRLMKALADGLNVPIGGLRKMAEQGMLTSDVLAKALPQSLNKLREEAASVQTISGAFVQLKNQLTDFLGVNAEASGAVTVLTTGIGLLAKNLDLLVIAALSYGAVKLAVPLLEAAAAAKVLAVSTLASYEATQIQRNGMLAATQATIADNTAKLAAVVAIREETVLRLAAANANILSARAAIQAAEAAGAQSFALRTLKMATAELTVAEQARALALAELAALGRQQAIVTAEIAAAQTAQNATMVAGAGAVGLLRGALAFLGGPIGLLTLAIGVGSAAWMYFGSKATEAKQKAIAAAQESEVGIANATAGMRAELDKLIKKYEDVTKAQTKGLGAAGFQTETAGNYQKQAAEAQRLANVLAAMNRNGGATTMLDGVKVDTDTVMKKIGAITAEMTRREDALKNAREHALEKMIATPGALTKAEARVKAVADITKHYNDVIAGELDPKKLAAAASMRDNAIAEVDKKAAKEGVPLADSILKMDVENAKRAMQQQMASYSDAEKVMEALRSAGKVSDADYYESTITYIRLRAEAEEAGLTAENARMAEENRSGKRSVDIQNKMAENESKMAILRASTSAQVEALGIQRVGALEKEKRATEQADAAAKNYLDTTRLQYSRNLAAVGLGTSAQSRLNGRNQIEDKYTAQLQKLADDKRIGLYANKDEQYKADLLRIQVFQQQALADWEVYYDRRKAMEGDWSNGASEALANYRDEAANVAGQINTLFLNGFNAWEEAWVNFAKTGKLSFSSLMDSVIADLARMQIKAASSGLMGILTSAMGNYFAGNSGAAAGVANALPGDALDNLINVTGGYGTIPGRASGGATAANGLYEVNEQGIEMLSVDGRDYLMMGNKGGHVTTNQELMRSTSGGASVAPAPVTVNISNAPADSTAAVTTSSDGNGGLNVEVMFSEMTRRMAGDIAKGQGPMAKAIGGTYGLKRQTRG